MLFKPLLGDMLSGALGGLVASHNKGGAYFRERVVPTNPNTPQQQAVRTQVAALASRWNSSMTQAQRDAWDTYAANVELTNRIGDPHNISGLAMFIRNNVTTAIHVPSFQLDGPTEFNLGVVQIDSMQNGTAAGQTVDFTFNNVVGVNPWANEAGSYLFAFVSRPQNANIKYFRGPYRFGALLQGDPAPPASPFVVAAPFPFIAGQRLFGRTVVSYLDGRYTADQFFTTLAVA